MAIVTVEKNIYKAESLYQWDLNQVLQIYGLSLPSIPEIHFTNDAMTRAIVRQATMDSSGVITVDVPNSLLQKPYKIKAYVCIYSGNTFESLYKVEIPVKARTKPGDYTLTDDEEVYSFNALENKIDNTLIESKQNYNQAIATYNKATDTYNEATEKVEGYMETVDRKFEEYIGYTPNEILMNTTKTLYSMDSAAVPNDVFGFIGKYAQHWWRRKAIEAVTRYKEKQTLLGSEFSSDEVKIYNVAQVSETVNVDPITGEITLVDPYEPVNIDDYRGHYFFCNAEDDSNTYTNELFYVKAYSTWYGASTDHIRLYVSDVYRVSAEAYEMDVGGTDYVQSPNSDTYPHSGDDGSFEYNYLGQPWENAVVPLRVATGSYVGAGVYGKSNTHNTLTFDFEPKLLIVRESTNDRNQHQLIVPYGTEEVRVSTSSSVDSCYFTWSGKTVSWYATGADYYQYNNSATTYTYFAIG